MPQESSNDELVRRHRELREAHIKALSQTAADKIVKLFTGKKQPTVAQVAEVIAREFEQLPG